MNSRRICQAVGSQYKDSAVGLVFMESAVELAMETSRVESAVRNQARAKLNQLQALKSKVNQLVRVLRSALENKIEEEDAQVTVDESVSSSDYKYC
ncbi:U-box domain-containing protein 33-like [Dorcoceras hygrometricum]|uniref:U-box domain-containing protein 33-like n=1 Tax=Dorcoceras hygrometricum TaxID=472368 RepID=A0A2Z6ZYZ1_9LAMI|nr:U-box domain-containing protein 33-like [Dorcoceras hygrometricum]